MLREANLRNNIIKKNIKTFVMDVDGTLTDGKIYMSSNGELCKVFDIKDGCGIHDILIPAGILPVIITGRNSEIVRKRCQEMGITEVYQGINNKLEKLLEITQDLGAVAYIGDDINDIICMSSVKESGGLVGCPEDAAKQVKELADFVSERSGGNGAVRDFIEWVLHKSELEDSCIQYLRAHEEKSVNIDLL